MALGQTATCGSPWASASACHSVGEITDFFDGLTVGHGAFGITPGPDGNLWFAEVDRIARITMGGVITEFTSGFTPNAGIADVTAEPDGNLWFVETAANRIGRITPSGASTEFAAGSRRAAADSDRRPWRRQRLVQRDRDTTHRSHHARGAVTEFGGLTAKPLDVALGADGNVGSPSRARPSSGGSRPPAR